MSRETGDANGCYEEPIIDLSSDLKPKVKVNITCPHCGADNVRESNNYHDILHKEYFDVDEVQDFNDIISKIDSGEYPYSILVDAYYWLGHFYCNECGKGVKINQRPYRHGQESHTTKAFSIRKAGKVLPYDVVKRFWKYLESKKREIPSDAIGYVKCEKQRFVDRVWKVLRPHVVDIPFLIKDNDGYRDIVYIGNIEYLLGWGEEIYLTVCNTMGKLYQIKLDHNGMKDFEWVEVDKDLAKKNMALLNEF